MLTPTPLRGAGAHTAPGRGYAVSSISINVNGVAQTRDVEPRMLLVHFLRDALGLTGTHVGCDTSQCGACTVLLDGAAVRRGPHLLPPGVGGPLHHQAHRGPGSQARAPHRALS